MATVTYSLDAQPSVFTANSFRTSDSQTRSDIAVNANGELALIYAHDFGGTQTDFDIVSRTFSTDGSFTPLNGGGERDQGGGNQFFGSVAALSNGNFVTVYEDEDGANNDIIEFEIFNAANNEVVGSTVVADVGFDQANATVTATANGFVVVWDHANGGGGRSIAVRRYDNDGVAQDPSSIVISGGVTARENSRASVTELANGNLLYTWREDVAGGGTDFDIRAVVFDSSNSIVIVHEFPVTTESDFQNDPTALALPGGGFVIAYVDARNGSSVDFILEMDVYGADGIVLANEIQVSDPFGDADFNDNGASLSVISDNYFAVTYAYSTTGSSADDEVYVQVYDFDGNRVLGETALSSSTLGAVLPELAGLTGGRFATTYTERDASASDNSGSHITLQGDQFVRTTDLDNSGEIITGDDIVDIMNGGTGDDTLNGFGGNDTLSGGSGVDTINGGDGDDRITGGFGTDIIDGGAGNDTFFMNGGEREDTLDGGADTDTLDLSGFTASGFLVDLAGQSYEVTVVPSAQTIQNVENVIGSAQNDTIVGDGEINNLQGGANGADGDTISYAGSSAGVTIDLQADTVSGGDAEGDTISGFENAIGSDENDIIGAAVNGTGTLEGGRGSDSLFAYGGSGTFLGGNDSDFIDAQLNIATSGATFDGGAGTDRFSTFGPAGGTFDLRDDTLLGIEILAIENNLAQTLEINAGQLATSGVTTLDGEASAGGTGADGVFSIFMDGETTLDLSVLTAVDFDQPGDGITVSGDGDAETITASAVRDNINVDAGDDTIIISAAGIVAGEFFDGGADTDTLDFSASNADYTINLTTGAFDLLAGGGGNDSLDGQNGADIMRGGTGIDGYNVDRIDDVVEENFNGGEFDILRTAVTYTLPDHVEILIMKGGSGTVIDAVGNDGPTNDVKNLMLGNNADNRIQTFDGNDVILGRGGNDRILAGGGHDNIAGGTGTDIVTGGAGSDLFNFTSIADAGDLITDFDISEIDVLDLRAMFDTFTGGSALDTNTAQAQGFLRLQDNGNSISVFADSDGTAGANAEVLLVLLNNVTDDVTAVDNFILV